MNKINQLFDDQRATGRKLLSIYFCAGCPSADLTADVILTLQQRGIDKQKARQLLVGAFMKEVLDKIPHALIPNSLIPLLNAVNGVVE